MGITGKISADPGNSVSVPRIRAFINDSESDGIVRQALCDLGIEDVVVSTGNVTTAISALAKCPSPRLLIVDITGVEDPVANILELNDVCEPGISIIGVGKSNDIGLYRRLKNAGVIEYFFKPLVRDLITRSCHDVLTDRFDQPSLYSGKLVFFLGVRGGVGTTTLATNAALFQAEVRQRWTMLVDMDVQSGDSALIFDVATTDALREAFEHPERVDKLFLERGAIHASQRLNMLSSLEPLDSLIEGTEESITLLLENLVRRYRAVFVDLPVSAAAFLPQILKMPSTCVLIGNQSLSSARDLARWREFIGPNTRERRTVSVLNCNMAHGGLKPVDFARACGQAPEIYIPYDRKLAEASNFGIQAMQKCSSFRAELSHLLHEVMGEPLGKSRSLIKRIFHK
ncbi:MAG: response regulator receiver protein [Alphaproteobacteria bacterium]